jgi:hypothetical protein
MDQNEILHDPRQLGVPSGASKMIYELTVRSAQTVHLSWLETNTVSKRTETSFHLSLVTQEYHPVHPKQFLSLRYVWRKPCTHHALKLKLYPTDRNKLLFEPRHLGVPSGVSNTISEDMVHLAQTVHLSCTETYSVSKWTKTSFHFRLVTQVYHPVHPKQFLSLRYVWRKPCTYQAPKLTLYPKGSKWDSTWPKSPRSSIECVQNDFWCYGTFGANCGPILHRY